MAGIDRTYANHYEEYKEFKDWADRQTITFYNGHRICVGDYVVRCKKEYFRAGMAIMNSPSCIDIYLIQNCKIKFVLDTLKRAYSKETYEKLQKFDLTAKPSCEFQQNRKITVIKAKSTKFPIHNKPYRKQSAWNLQTYCGYRYHEKTKTWAHVKSYYPFNTNMAHVKSIKSLVRHLRKQYLQKGIEFFISGMYVGEHYLVTIK